MATLTTLVIANKALVLCGASPITALTEDSPNARALNAVYESARQSILCECKWNFSVTRSTLSTVATNTIAWFATGESIVYTKPSAALRIWELSSPCALWREEGNYLISDTAGLGAKYTFDNTDAGIYPANFVTAFIDKLCSDICFMILNSGPKAEAFLSKYQKVSLPQAMAENSQTGTQQSPVDDEWLAAKYGGGGDPSHSYG